MYRLSGFISGVVPGLLALSAQFSGADAPLELGINPCTSGYVYSHYNEINDWDVCIESSLYVANEGGEVEDFDDGCPILDSGKVLQAWNPEAGVCFQIQQEAVVADNDIFTVTRDVAMGQIRVDLHDDAVDAGCSGWGIYLPSPGNVYCIKDVGGPVELSFAEIEDMAEAYFERLYECIADNARQLQILIGDYQRYVEFAYFESSSAKVKFELSTYSKSTSRSKLNQNQQSFGYTTEERCRIPNVSKIIGLINK